MPVEQILGHAAPERLYQQFHMLEPMAVLTETNPVSKASPNRNINFIDYSFIIYGYKSRLLQD